MAQQKLADIPVTASRLKQLANELKLSGHAQERAFSLSKLKPDNGTWLQFVDRLLLICGVTLAVTGVMAFFAYNWADLHKFAKFALIQGALVACVAVACRKGMHHLSGKAALFGAAVLTGVLLAVYGQTYQTGADPYGLFFTWAILITGWALIGRNGGLWLLLLVLLNLSLVMYWTQLVHPEDWGVSFARELGPFAGITYSLTDFALAQWVFALNVAALVGWEYFSKRGLDWMQSRSFPRIIAVFALVPVLISTLIFILAAGEGDYWGVRYVSPLFFALFSVGVLYYFSKKYLDMFILAVSCLSLIVVITTVLARVMDMGFDMFIILGMVVVALSAAATQWLRKVKIAWENAA